MKIRQVSVFIENKSGRLCDVMHCLKEHGINIRALSLADTSDFGILRLIVNKPDDAFNILKEKDFTVAVTDVIAVLVDDKPGGLSDVLDILKKYNVSIEYMYAYVEYSSDKAIMIFRFEDTDATLGILAKENIKVLKGEAIYSL